jgi:hypothetical protein
MSSTLWNLTRRLTGRPARGVLHRRRHGRSRAVRDEPRGMGLGRSGRSLADLYRTIARSDLDHSGSAPQPPPTAAIISAFHPKHGRQVRTIAGMVRVAPPWKSEER